jgi:hypothetical protein
MHGHHEDITKVNLLLTEPSQVSEVGPREGEQQAARPATLLRGSPNDPILKLRILTTKT